MDSARKWMGDILLRSPAPLRRLRNVPVLGEFIHRLSHRILPADERAWVQVETGPAQGLWLELNPRTGQDYLRGQAESPVQKILAERLRPGMIFYDLGANIGFYSLMAARILGANGQIFSFEPDSKAVERLRHNIARNGFQNVTIVEAGVWSESGTMNFVAADPSSPDHGTGRITREGDAARGRVARCVALDDFTQGAPPPDAIKCDVEGAEVEVFRGAKNLLKAFRPWIICEMHSDANDRATREFLSGFGYAFETIDVNHVMAAPRNMKGLVG
jgi:FkbM family methyltransferase